MSAVCQKPCAGYRCGILVPAWKSGVMVNICFNHLITPWIRVVANVTKEKYIALSASSFWMQLTLVFISASMNNSHVFSSIAQLGLADLRWALLQGSAHMTFILPLEAAGNPGVFFPWQEQRHKKTKPSGQVLSRNPVIYFRTIGQRRSMPSSTSMHTLLLEIGAGEYFWAIVQPNAVVRGEDVVDDSTRNELSETEKEHLDQKLYGGMEEGHFETLTAGQWDQNSESEQLCGRQAESGAGEANQSDLQALLRTLNFYPEDSVFSLRKVFVHHAYSLSNLSFLPYEFGTERKSYDYY